MKKKLLGLISAVFLGMFSLTSCFGAGGTKETKESNGQAVTSIEKLNIAFVPSKDPEQIISATEPLKVILKDEIVKQGYQVGEVDISVGTSYDAVGEALASGSVDVGFIPGGTYVMYEDSADVLLTSTRKALSKNSDNPKDWNDGTPTEQIDGKQAVSYRSLIIAGPSPKGKELAQKVNNGEKLTWDDLNSAKWSVMGPTSSAGYLYPTIWLQENYGKSISDLTNKVQADSYGSSIARLASEQIDVALFFADARIDYQNKWTTEYGRENSIWEETNVIGVTPPIYNDTVSVSKNSKIMTDEFKNVLATSLKNIANTDEGKKIISIYSHDGYELAKSSDYDNERKVQSLIREINSK